MGRTPCCSKEGITRGAWAALEDKILTEYVKIHGEGKWRNVPKQTGLKRCGKSCRLRWLNYLRPDIKRGNISDEEEDLIIRLHKLLGNRWSLIARRLPGRTDNEIKNYWNTILVKKLYGKQSKQSGDEKKKSNQIQVSDQTPSGTGIMRHSAMIPTKEALVNENLSSHTATEDLVKNEDVGLTAGSSILPDTSKECDSQRSRLDFCIENFSSYDISDSEIFRNCQLDDGADEEGGVTREWTTLDESLTLSEEEILLQDWIVDDSFLQTN
ncbi:hypothetical protein K2173_017541 [Erythroxylum novogranatense]|uniref:Uncharacterized protein n=1 Tax=Erythroxylum novogranatense TaxID=1862640 RepID=A0AAV8TKN7_9ROSI|nr:hypothetical protein K2173_017541 [Erythroxylum novogranatense]